MSDNMKLWEAVWKTDPKYTKTVKLGRQFTAIDPYYQIMRATEQFGPAGQGWGWEVKRVDFLETKEIAVLVRMWVKGTHETGRNDNVIEQWGQNGLFIDGAMKKKDTDCMKKATTDAVTKCLSYMGFSADVFLGKFDDNKYVQERKDESAAKEKAEAAKPIEPTAEEREWLMNILSELQDAMSQEEIMALWNQTAATYRVMDARNPIKAQYVTAFKTAKERVNEAIGPATKPSS